MRIKRQTDYVFVLLLSLLITGCEPGQLFGPTSTPARTATLTSTFTPTSTQTPTSSVTPTITPSPTLYPIGHLDLHAYGLALRYRTSIWQRGEDQSHRGFITHRSIADCRIREWGPGSVYGELVSTTTLGTITYEIWGWTNSDGTRTRHYFALSGFENPSAPNIPDIEVLLPSGDTLPCIADVATVLATLQILQESMLPNTGSSVQAGLRPPEGTQPEYRGPRYGESRQSAHC